MGIREYRGQILCDKRWPDGKRFKRKFANETQAKEMLADIDYSIRHGTWQEFRDQIQLRNRDSVTLQEFSRTYMEQYAQVRNKKGSCQRKEVALRAINPKLGNLELEMISPAHLHHYVKKRKQHGVSDATINREITIIKHMLNHAVDLGYIDENPVRRFRLLREDRKERRRFTDEEIDKVLHALRPECRPPFIFMKETGCRREEALSLTHFQVQEDSRLVVFSENTKSRRYRYVPLTDLALAAIQALPRLPESPYVFYDPKTGRRWKYCRRGWEEARGAAGLPEMQAKDLRRHFAITLAEAGADMHDIQQVLGHSSVATTEKYYAQFSPRHSARKILRVLQGGRPSGTKAELDDQPRQSDEERRMASA